MAEELYSIQGFLWKHKKGVTGGTWKKNWVYADHETILQYSGNQRPLQNETAKYSWKVVNCEIRPSKLRRFAFEIVHRPPTEPSNQEIIVFAADDGASYQQWMKILVDNRAITERAEPTEEVEEEREESEEAEEKQLETSASRIERMVKSFFKRKKVKKVRMLSRSRYFL